MLTALATISVLAAIGAPGPAPAAIEVPDAGWSELRSRGLAHLRLVDPARALAFLDAAAAKPMPPRERAKTALLIARAANAAKKPRRALDALDSAEPGDFAPVLRDLADWERARAMANAGDPGAVDALARFLDRYPGSDRRDEARLLLGRGRLKAGDRASARDLAQKVLKAARSDDVKAEAVLLAADASSGPKRRSLLVRLATEFPAAPAARRAGIRESDLTKDQLKDRADGFFRAMDYEGYQRVLKRLWDGGDHSPRLAKRLAMTHLVYVRDDARRALDLIDLAQEGGAVGRAEAVYLKARAHAKLEEYDEAANLYRRYLKLAPRGRRRVKALYYLGWLPYDHGRYQQALPHLDAFLRKVRRHDLRSYVVWAKAWSLYNLNRHREALRVFDRMLRMGNPLVAGKAMYWGGMSNMALGRGDEASKWMRMAVDRYPMTWYAVLAAKRLNEWNGTPLPNWIVGPSPGLPEPEAFWPFDGLPEKLADRLREVKDLSDVGEIARARNAYRKIARRVERRFRGVDRARLLLTVHDAIEDYHTLYRRARQDFGKRLGRVPDRDSALFWMLRYPRAHRGLAGVLAERFSLPEQWIYSIMRQESRYRHDQVSHTAALGIMQMIPKTARIVSRALGVPFDADSFFGPGRNLLFGNYYLGALLRDFKGQIVFASAAYNAGAPPIKRFMATHAGKPFDAMVEHISYNEARNYCRMVAGHLVRYAYLHLTAEQRKALYAKLFPDAVDYDLGREIDY